MKRSSRPLLFVCLLLFHYVLVFANIDSRESVSDELSPCAVKCWEQSSSAAGCALTDTECQCGKKNVDAEVSTCVLYNCTYEDRIELSRVWAQRCNPPHNNQNTELRAAVVVGGTVAFLMVGIRIVARLCTVRFWWDDWCHITAGVFAVPLTVFSNLCVTDGMGYRLYDIKFPSMTQARNLFIWYYLSEIFYCLEIYFIKMSILCLYIRIFPETSHLSFIITMVLLTASLIILLPMIIWQCVPIHAIWDLHRSDARCLSVSGVAYANAAVNLATEVAILVLPLPLLQRLRVSKSKKAALYALFGAGSLVIAIASARVPSLAHVLSTEDPTYANRGVFYWTSAETSVAHICATALTVRPLYLKLRGMCRLRRDKGSNIPGTDMPRVCSVSKPGGARTEEDCQMQSAEESYDCSDSSAATSSAGV